MNKIQSILMELLTEVDQICKKNHIIYYLAAGCALGAVRNGGFLPWDDDVDLYITRDNWECLKRVMEQEIPENRDFVCNENLDLYCNPVGRYVDKGSTVTMRSQLINGRTCGVMVEFFIFDPMPISEIEKFKHRKYMKAYVELLSPYFLLANETLEHNVDFDYKLYNKYYWLGKLIGRNRALNILLKKFTSFPESDCEELCARWGQRTGIYPKELFGNGKEMMFEGKKFPLVEYPEKVFRIGYGDDWMYVPEVDNQASHDSVKNLDEPFATYRELYMPLIDRSKLLKAYKKRKRAAIKGLRIREKYEYDFALICAELYAEKICNQGISIEQLKKMLETKNFETLGAALDQFYTLQADKRLQANDILIPLPDDYIYIAIMNYILQGEYYKAEKIMKYREKDKWGERGLSDALNFAKRLMLMCRELSVAIYDEKNTNSVESILDDNSDYNWTLDFDKANLWLIYKRSIYKKDFEILLSEARTVKEKHGSYGEVLRFEGYALYKLGRINEARKIYKDAILNTRNAFVWQEAQKLLGIDAYNLYFNKSEDEGN